ncbi:hypothetical protein [Dactylosporangium sp. CA-139066]|uniref:hypothetical protein n=1 Tax=Dactylosporangium sp. CA-139066 TaxID=3239930 RepID=UPI003D941A83
MSAAVIRTRRPVVPAPMCSTTASTVNGAAPTKLRANQPFWMDELMHCMTSMNTRSSVPRSASMTGPAYP